VCVYVYVYVSLCARVCMDVCISGSNQSTLLIPPVMNAGIISTVVDGVRIYQVKKSNESSFLQNAILFC
jgi:hypothetical protein